MFHCCRNPVNWTPWNHSAGLETLGPHDCKMTIRNNNNSNIIYLNTLLTNPFEIVQEPPPMKGIPIDYSSPRNHIVVEGSPCILNAPTFAIYVNEVTADKDTRHAACLNDQVMATLLTSHYLYESDTGWLHIFCCICQIFAFCIQTQSAVHMSQSHSIPYNVRASCQMLSKHSSFSHIDIVPNLNDCSSVNLLSSGAGTAFRKLEINNNFLHHREKDDSNCIHIPSHACHPTT